MLKNFEIKANLGATDRNGNEKKGQKKAKKKRKKSSVRHTRAIQRDRRKRQLAAPPDEKIKARLSELVKPSEAEEEGSVDPISVCVSGDSHLIRLECG